MLRNKILFPLLLSAILSLASCSGLPKSGGGGGGGNTTLSLTMTDVPLAGTSILSFKVTVTGVSLTPSTGKAVSLTLNPTTPIVELTRLQSDSAFLGTSTVPSANYTSATVSFTSPDIVLVNQTNVALAGGTPAPCPLNALTTCEFKPTTSGTITLTAAPFPLTLTPNQQTGLSLDFNLNNAITMTNGAVSVDFTQANVLTAATLPRTGTPTGALDLIEDFTGIITTISGNSVTVHSDTRGNITAVANSSTTFNNLPVTCAAQNITCLDFARFVGQDCGEREFSADRRVCRDRRRGHSWRYARVFGRHQGLERGPRLLQLHPFRHAFKCIRGTNSTDSGTSQPRSDCGAQFQRPGQHELRGAAFLPGDRDGRHPACQPVFQCFFRNLAELSHELEPVGATKHPRTNFQSN